MRHHCKLYDDFFKNIQQIGRGNGNNITVAKKFAGDFILLLVKLQKLKLYLLFMKKCYYGKIIIVEILEL